MGNRITIYSDKPVAWKALVSQGAAGPTGSADDKADLDAVTGLVPMEELPFTQSGAGGLIARLTDDGRLMVTRGGVAEYVATSPELQEAVDALTGGGGVLAKVGAPEYSGSLSLNTDGTTPTTIPTAGVYDAASDEGYHCFLALQYTGPGGLKIRRKANGSAVTNLAGDPSLETGAAPGWSSTGGVTLSVSNASARSGTYSLRAVVTAGGTTGQAIYSPWYPIEQGLKASTAGYLRRFVGASKTNRVDAQYGNATATNGSSTGVISSVTGSNVTPGTDWTTRGIMDSAHLGGTGSQTAPTGATQVRLRWTIVSPDAGNEFGLDDYQVERADTIPAYGSTGGSGSALSMYGGWATPTPTPIAQAAGVTPVVSTFATTGAQYLSGFQSVGVGGTGLTGQRIEYEAMVATPGQATTITWAVLSYARVRVPS